MSSEGRVRVFEARYAKHVYRRSCTRIPSNVRQSLCRDGPVRVVSVVKHANHV